ncbi:hypothetical protein ACQP1U_04150 [Actinomycetota bacterium]
MMQPQDCVSFAQGMALVLPEPYAFSHTTAVRLWTAPTPRIWTPREPLDVMRPDVLGALTRKEVLGHTGLDLRETDIVRRLPVTSMAWTVLDVAGLGYWSRNDVIALGDAFLNRSETLLDELVALSLLPRRRRVRKLREAIPFMRVGSRSAMESLTRIKCAEGGLPEPELNQDIVELGEWLGEVDFLWRKARVIVDFEGDYHWTDKRQWRIDTTRRRLFRRYDYDYIPITAGDINDDALLSELIEQLRRALG